MIADSGYALFHSGKRDFFGLQAFVEMRYEYIHKYIHTNIHEKVLLRK